MSDRILWLKAEKELAAEQVKTQELEAENTSLKEEIRVGMENQVALTKERDDFYRAAHNCGHARDHLQSQLDLANKEIERLKNERD